MWNNIVQYNIDRETSQKAYINLLFLEKKTQIINNAYQVAD